MIILNCQTQQLKYMLDYKAMISSLNLSLILSGSLVWEYGSIVEAQWPVKASQAGLGSCETSV